MATTDARSGFRLPWSTDQRPADGSDEGAEFNADGSLDAGFAAKPAEADPMTDAVDVRRDAPPIRATGEPAGHAPSAAPPPGAPKRPSKFMADLTKAMQVAAESAREETLGRLQADAKAHVEEVHARSSGEAADLRRRADDDVAAVREWSKTEIARVREETESRISARKGRLETEIDEHAALIERQVERVHTRVGAFEAEMAAWFERLLGEEDPTRFASMAGSLPEPPPFDLDLGAAAAAAMVDASDDSPAPVADWTASRGDAVEDPDAAMGATRGAAEAAERDYSTAAPDEPARPADPRISALGLSADFEAAEAEAFAAAETGEEPEIPTITDEALAARLAGLVPDEDVSPVLPTPSTQVVVIGLVSVASIASFKRHLGRLQGVQSVGVSSGPDGEFVFTVIHSEGVSLRDAVPSLPGFQARVTGGNDRVVEVAARDPENEA